MASAVCVDCAGVLCVPPDVRTFRAVAHVPVALAAGDQLQLQLVASTAAAGFVPLVANASKVLYDPTPPKAGNVSDVTPCGCLLPANHTVPWVHTANASADASFLCSSETSVSHIPMATCVGASWGGFGDAEAPKGITYAVCVGSAPLLCDVVPMAPNATAAESLAVDLGRECCRIQTRNPSSLEP
jgi:hypothetical protein